MRYYTISISNPVSGEVVKQYTSFPNGATDPGALNIELDISVSAFSLPTTDSQLIRIWGIPLQDIWQATNLVGMTIMVYGGMKPGLPLATAASGQAGLLLAGTIYPAYGNWIGTEMTLDLQVVPYFYAGLQVPVNIVLNWPKGMPLATALATTLSTAFPAWKQTINISPNLVLNYDMWAAYPNMPALAQSIKQITRPILGGDYAGVDMAWSGTSITVLDGTAQPPPPKQILFQDLIGQPTWRDLYLLQAKTVMRADIAWGSFVTMPPALATLTGQAVVPPGSSVPSRSNSGFQGTFQVIRIRHVGNFRQPDAASWNTTFDLLPNPVPALPANAGPPINLQGNVTLGTPVVVQ